MRPKGMTEEEERDIKIVSIREAQVKAEEIAKAVSNLNATLAGVDDGVRVEVEIVEGLVKATVTMELLK